MRLFAAIGVEPNDRIRKMLSEAKGLGLRTVAEDNLHINLKFLGEVDEGQIEGIKKALDTAAGFGGFDIGLSGMGAFPNPDFIRVIWIGVKSDKVSALADLIDCELERLGFNKEKSYTPHITLARVPKRVEGLKELLGERDFGRQEVKEIHLIRSTLAPEGPRYNRVHTVRL